MIVAKAFPEGGGVGGRGKKPTSAGQFPMVPKTSLNYARMVLREAPDGGKRETGKTGAGFAFVDATMSDEQITDDDIRAAAERKGFRFEEKKPWEFCPWEIDGPCPFQTTEHWERAARFRDELIAEIEASRAAKPKPRAKRRR